MNNQPLHNHIEAILFYFGEAQSIKKLAGILTISAEEVEQGITELSQSLNGRGVILIREGDTVMLATSKDSSQIIESLQKEELNKELSRATLETLSVILYKTDCTRADIDYIRGVNSSFILRNLLIRGLISKETHPDDSRKYIYTPTIELMAFMGVEQISQLPEYEAYHDMLNKRVMGREEKE